MIFVCSLIVFRLMWVIIWWDRPSFCVELGTQPTLTRSFNQAQNLKDVPTWFTGLMAAGCTRPTAGLVMSRLRIFDKDTMAKIKILRNDKAGWCSTLAAFECQGVEDQPTEGLDTC